ncbi:hypothetical protein ZOSMA_183G00230 [Zostera marina]|uniref:NAD-dependent epimerase/dehydratase domain-containing protein n=1 Tax=Zostera marina TaxID=29655 RepID=A0A0K9PQP6_ZOSMR|nr:hypothetical protein ZOSMA_183G00230 [Zostera marina]
MTICMIGAGGFIGSHLCVKLLFQTPHTILVVDVYINNKISHLLDQPESGSGTKYSWSGRIQFHRLNIKNDSCLEGLIKMSGLTINLAVPFVRRQITTHVRLIRYPVTLSMHFLLLSIVQKIKSV